MTETQKFALARARAELRKAREALGIAQKALELEGLAYLAGDGLVSSDVLLAEVQEYL